MNFFLNLLLYANSIQLSGIIQDVIISQVFSKCQTLETILTDIRIQKFAQILVDHSTKVQSGDRVGITTTTVAEPLVRALYEQILERGGYPHVLMDFPGQDELFLNHANNDQLEFVPLFHKMAFEQFDVLIKIRAEANTRALASIDPARQAKRQKAIFNKFLNPHHNFTVPDHLFFRRSGKKHSQSGNIDSTNVHQFDW